MGTQRKNRRLEKTARMLVVLPTLGERTDLLRKTLDSIKMQSPVMYDVVMIYPLKSTDTAALAKEYGAISVDDPGGISAAVNAGIAQAKRSHDYVTWIGDDDIVTENSFSVAMKLLDQAPKAVVAFGYCDYIDSEGNKLFTSRAGNLAPWLMTWGPNLVPCPGAVFRLSAIRSVGAFDETNKYSMDLDMFLRLRKIGKFINTKRVQAAFRWHPTSTTVANRAKVVKETEAVKRKHLPKFLRPFTPLWNYPVRVATTFAARRVNHIAERSLEG